MEILEYARLPESELRATVERRKREKRAIILAHNYQVGPVQAVADAIADSLKLAQIGRSSDAQMIVLCGVRFMAETAKILSPRKKVLLPSEGAGCPMADMITRDELRAFKARHAGAPVVCYVNTPADVKAESDVCCTSSNAVKIVSAMEGDEVLFVPDKNLAAYVATKVAKRIIPWDGHCYVHTMFTPEDVELARGEHPGAKVVVHPECPPEVVALADAVASTEGMMRLAAEHRELIVGTEIGLIERMNREHADRRFYPLSAFAVCRNMKLTDLPRVAWALEHEEYAIEVPEHIRVQATRGRSVSFMFLHTANAERG
jgi:quinolinate synthase